MSKITAWLERARSGFISVYLKPGLLLLSVARFDSGEKAPDKTLQSPSKPLDTFRTSLPLSAAAEYEAEGSWATAQGNRRLGAWCGADRPGFPRDT